MENSHLSNKIKQLMWVNGEIYNYQDILNLYQFFLKQRVTVKLYLLYTKFGVEFVKYIRGMFSFSILI